MGGPVLKNKFSKKTIKNFIALLLLGPILNIILSKTLKNFFGGTGA
jgi:hypothetical protein